MKNFVATISGEILKAKNLCYIAHLTLHPTAEKTLFVIASDVFLCSSPANNRFNMLTGLQIATIGNGADYKCGSSLADL